MQSFAVWMRELLDRRQLGIREFVRRAEPDRDEGSAAAYLSAVLRGLKPPPLDRLEAWAESLGLGAEERQRFLDLAAIEHLPAAARPRFRALLQAELRAAEPRRGRYRADDPS